MSWHARHAATGLSCVVSQHDVLRRLTDVRPGDRLRVDANTVVVGDWIFKRVR